MFRIILVFLCLSLIGCSTCGPTTHLKKIPVNVPKEIQVLSGQPGTNRLELDNGIIVTISWINGAKYESKNLSIVVWRDPKKTKVSFNSNQLIELDAATNSKTNTYLSGKFVPFQENDGYQAIIETESFLETIPKIFQFPKLTINDRTYNLPDIKIMKVTEELCFRPGI